MIFAKAIGKFTGHVYRIEFSILSGLGPLPLAKFFTQRLYVLRSKHAYNGVCDSHFLIIYPSKSCHIYCCTPHIHFGP
jgi:hypothetical protein